MHDSCTVLNGVCALLCLIAADLFTEIDSYLRKEQVRFRDLFRHYDRNGGFPCAPL